jgi:uncharacterized protein with PIN domain
MSSGARALLLDSMLGSLARKLRLYGIDAEYSPSSSDEELLQRAREEHRVLLTSDRELASRAKRMGLDVLLVEERSDARALAGVFLALGMRPEQLSPDKARCTRCNGEVTRVAKEEVRRRVGPRTYSRHDEFYRCLRCGRLYWEGAHWKRIRALHAEVLRLLGEAYNSRHTL